MRLYHPDRFALEPEKQETYQRLTAAINQAKANGDLAELRKIAEDPHDYILRQGWAPLDFSDEEQVDQIRRLWESIELEIMRVLEARQQLKASPEYELWQMSEQTPKLFDVTVNHQIVHLTRELGLLQTQADALAREITELTGEAAEI